MPLRVPKSLPKILLVFFLLIFIIQIAAILWMVLSASAASAQL